VHVKAKNAPKSTRAGDPTIGDCWTWTAIDADSKLLLSYLVGCRDAEFALMLMDDLRGHLAYRVQPTTDGHRAYLQAVEEAFGADADIDYAMLVTLYGAGSALQTTRQPDATVPPSASKRALTTLPATPTGATSARPTSSGRTSPCV
jgi:hypothetical protein